MRWSFADHSTAASEPCARFALLVSTAILMVMSVGSPPTPIDCSGGPNLSVASFGDYVWRLRSSSDGADVLRIVVPPTTANAPGLLSVEERVGTFQQIIVDLGNVVRPQHNVNVTIVLCGAPSPGRPATDVLNLTDRPLTPAILITGSSASPSIPTTFGRGVLVAVILDRDAQLRMRNVTSLILVDPFPANSSHLIDVALELRSGCVVELYDVPFVLCNSDRVRFVLTAFNANIQCTITAPTSSSVAVLSVNASGGGGGSIYVGLTLCNVSIVQVTSPDGSFLLLTGDAVSVTNVTVALVKCNVSPIGNVVSVRGSRSSTVTNLSVACHDTIVHCGRSLASISAATSVNVVDATISGTLSSITFSGSQGTMLNIESSVGCILLSNVTATVKGSSVSFDGEGYLVLASAAMNTSANCLSATVVSSNLIVRGSQGALLFIQSSSGNVYITNVAATAESGSTVGFDVQGYLGYVLAVGTATASCVSTAVVESIVTVGGSNGALLDIESSAGSAFLSNLTVTVESGSTVSFGGQGCLVYASAVIDGSATAVLITVVSSIIGKSHGALLIIGKSHGALLYFESTAGTLILSNVNAAVTRSAIDVAGEGYLVLAVAMTYGLSNCVSAAVDSSNVTVGVGGGALFYEKARSGSVDLSSITALVTGGSTVDFSGEGYLVLASAIMTGSANCVATSVHSSNVSFRGRRSALFYVEYTNGSLALSNATAIVKDGSFVGFDGQGGLVLVVAGDIGSVSGVSATVVSSSVNVRGSPGALVCIQSINGSVLLSNAAVTVESSSMAFVGDGLLVFALAVNISSACCLSAVVVSSKMVAGSGGALVCIQSSDGNVNLSNATGTVEGGSDISFGGEGYLVFATTIMNGRASCVFATVDSSNVTFGKRGALLFVESTDDGSVFLSNATATAEGNTTISFVNDGCLLGASAVRDIVAHSLAAVVSSSMVTTAEIGGSLLMLNGSTESFAVESTWFCIVRGSYVLLPRAGRVADISHNGVASAYRCCGVSPVVRVVVDHSVLLVSELMRCLVTDCNVALHLSTIVVTGPFLLADVSPALLLLTITNSLLIASTPTSKLYISPPSRGTSNVTVFSSSCGLIGWYNNTVSTAASSKSSMEWTLGVADRFFSGHLDKLPFPSRALRKLDVVGAEHVTAVQCAWGRGSHEFRATDSLSTSASPSTTADAATMTVPSSMTVTRQQSAVKASVPADKWCTCPR